MQAGFSLKDRWPIGVGLAGVLVVVAIIVVLSQKAANTPSTTPTDTATPSESARENATSSDAVFIDPAPQSDGRANAEQKPDPFPDARLANEPPAPELVIGVNGVGEAEAFGGWPLILEAGLLHPNAYEKDADHKPMLLAVKEGPWSGALQILVKNEIGKSEDWPFKLASSLPETFSLGVRASAELLWWLAPEETAKFPEGNYELVAILDTRESSAEGGWKGIVRSDPVTVRMSNEPSPLSTGQESEKHQLFAVYSFLRDDPKRAMAHADELLKRQPENVGALELKADLLARGGRDEEALDFYDRAIDAFFNRYGTREPPQILLRKQGEILSKFFAQEAPQGLVKADAHNQHDAALTEHTLWAETPAGKQNKPLFPADSKKLVFAWTLSAAVPNEPIDARWIAADTGGVAPPDYLIASSKSEPVERSGQFTLSSPKKGFPPGSYRLELWQSDKWLHTERFAVGD